MKQRIHLVGKGCSGRAVTLKQLEPRENDKALFTAAKTLGPTATQLELKITANREAVKMAVVEVTTDSSMKDDFRVTTKSWKKVTLQDLDEEGGALSYDRLFTPKDDGILSAICNSDPTAKEVEAISAGAIPLTED